MAKKTRKQNLDPIVITPKMVKDAKAQYPELFPGTQEHGDFLDELSGFLESVMCPPKRKTK